MGHCVYQIILNLSRLDVRPSAYKQWEQRSDDCTCKLYPPPKKKISSHPTENVPITYTN
jgi:hypothetical protein